MPQQSLEERVAYLEGKVEEHSRGYGQLREDIQLLRSAVQQQLDQRLNARIDALGQKVDRLGEELAGRIDALGEKVDRFREELSRRIEALDQKFSWWFSWLAGILITALLVQTGLLGAALFRR